MTETDLHELGRDLQQLREGRVTSGSNRGYDLDLERMKIKALILIARELDRIADTLDILSDRH
jgi:hypothetical protein